MTRDELEAVVAGKMSDENVTSSDILDTIFAALKEPTWRMMIEFWVDADTYQNRDIWQAMLTASPLAPNNKENK